MQLTTQPRGRGTPTSGSAGGATPHLSRYGLSDSGYRVTDPREDAITGYELALKRAEYVRSEWESAGEPLTLTQTNGVEGKHPLWSALLEAESFLLRARAALKAADRRGRPTGSSSSPDRRPSKLRAVV